MVYFPFHENIVHPNLRPVACFLTNTTPPLYILTCSVLFPQNIQSTNWQSMRFKPPPPNSSIGWRVEFRPLEVQLTDFENAAFVVFVVLLTRAILSFKLNLYIPITKVTETTPIIHIC